MSDPPPHLSLGAHQEVERSGWFQQSGKCSPSNLIGMLSGWLRLSVRAPWPRQVEGVPAEADSYTASTFLKVPPPLPASEKITDLEKLGGFSKVTELVRWHLSSLPSATHCEAVNGSHSICCAGHCAYFQPGAVELQM